MFGTILPSNSASTFAVVHLWLAEQTMQMRKQGICNLSSMFHGFKNTLMRKTKAHAAFPTRARCAATLTGH